MVWSAGCLHDAEGDADQLSETIDVEYDATALETDYEESAPKSSTRRCHKTIVPICVLTFCIVLGILKRHALEAVLEDILAECKRLGIWSAVLLVVCSAIFNVCMVPTLPLIIGAGVEYTLMYGAVFGPMLGVASMFLGTWIGSLVAFQLGRTVWKDYAKGEHAGSEAFQTINAMIEDEGVKIVLLARMSPLLPAEVFNYVCSVTNLTLWQYAIGCLGSVVPVSFWVVTAAQATDAADKSRKHHHLSLKGDILLVLVNIVVLILLSGLLYRAYRRHRKKNGEQCLVLAS